MRAYRERAPYVRARFEMAGVELNGIELDGADMSDMHAYGDLFTVTPVHATFPITHDEPADFEPQITTVVTFHVPRIEPHQTPPWSEPPAGFV